MSPWSAARARRRLKSAGALLSTSNSVVSLDDLSLPALALIGPYPAPAPRLVWPFDSRVPRVTISTPPGTCARYCRTSPPSRYWNRRRISFATRFRISRGGSEPNVRLGGRLHREAWWRRDDLEGIGAYKLALDRQFPPVAASFQSEAEDRYSDRGIEGRARL